MLTLISGEWMTKTTTEKNLLEALRRICVLDPTLPIGEPPDPHFFIRQAQGIAREAIENARK